MRLATTLFAVAVVGSVGGAAWGVPLLSDLMKATKDMQRGVQNAADSATSTLQGASNAASGAVKGVTGAASKITRALTDSEYYSLKHIMDIYGGCLFSYCQMNVFNSTAKRECEAKKTKNCTELDQYSLMDYLSYQLSQLWVKIAPGKALKAGIAQANAAAGNALKMG